MRLTSDQLSKLKLFLKDKKIAAAYEYLAHIARATGSENKFLPGVDPAVVVWLEGAASVNRGQGVFSDFIRNYTSYQHEIRFGRALIKEELDKLSNLIGSSVINGALKNRSFPTLNQITSSDATNSVGIYFYNNASAWAGNFLFLALGNDVGFKQNLLHTNKVGLPDLYDLFVAVGSLANSTNKNLQSGGISELVYGLYKAVNNNGLGWFNSLGFISKSIMAANQLLNEVYGEGQISLDKIYHGGLNLQLVLGSHKNDNLILGKSDYIVSAGPGQDRIVGGNKAEFIDGGADGDTIIGSGGNDYLFGGLGDDDLYGNTGNDILDGGSGYNNLYGGAGNDTYHFRGDVAFNGNDYIEERPNEGYDTVIWNGIGTFNFINIEKLVLDFPAQEYITRVFSNSLREIALSEADDVISITVHEPRKISELAIRIISSGGNDLIDINDNYDGVFSAVDNTLKLYFPDISRGDRVDLSGFGFEKAFDKSAHIPESKGGLRYLLAPGVIIHIDDKYGHEIDYYKNTSASWIGIDLKSQDVGLFIKGNFHDDNFII